jgi:nuclear migration protein JNM1
MKNELAQLEAEAAGSTDSKDEPTELMRELSDMRGRLTGVGGRTRLINAMVHGKNKDKAKPEANAPARNVPPHSAEPEISSSHGGGVVDMDRRIAQLEKLIGASGTSLDEVSVVYLDCLACSLLDLVQSSPLPQPLLPHLTRISTLLTLLAQPRHIDSISRRLKLLLTDLERYNASGSASGPGAPLSPALAELAPLLQRLAPHITTIPAVLARLRTLSALHASAAGFGDAVSGLEEDQRRLRAGLAELEEAVEGLEGSISDNSGTITRNVEGLEARIASLEERLAGLSAV